MDGTSDEESDYELQIKLTQQNPPWEHKSQIIVTSHDLVSVSLIYSSLSGEINIPTN